MATHTENFVPKVHPLERGAEPGDPMELIASPVHGDPDVMVECIVQEFAWMGWDSEQLLALFRSPGYPVLNQLMKLYGEENIRRRIESALDRVGSIRFSETIVEDAEPDREPELIQLTIRSAMSGEE
jgi:hypothetical protein